jgi:integrase
MIKLRTLKSRHLKLVNQYVKIEDDVIKVLLKHKVLQDKVKKEVQEQYLDQDFIHARSKKSFFGYPIGPHPLRYRMRTILKQSKIKKQLTPHNLRHTHTSLLAEA